MPHIRSEPNVHIKRFEVTGLPKADSPLIAQNLNLDLNIFTGRNGSGKTTLLKLLWYVISGNIEHAAREVPFSSVYVETNAYSIRIKKRNTEIEEVTFVENGETETIEAIYDSDGDAVTTPSLHRQGKERLT